MGAQSNRQGFTLLEVIAVVGIIGVIVAIALAVVSPGDGPAEIVKLENDTRAINSAVDLYRTFGGSLDSVSTPQDVLEKLKTKADSLSSEQTAGLSGSFLDQRVMAQMQTAAQAATNQPRAIWDMARGRFLVVSSGAIGVRQFVIDETIPPSPALVEARSKFMKLATSDSWIWDYTELPASGLVAPTPVTTHLVSGGPAGPPMPPAPPTPGPLAPPIFSAITGSFSITRFDLQLYLSDSNPGGVGKIVYSLNSSVWLDYTGVPIVVPPGANVRAMTQAVDPAWSDSPEVAHDYAALPERLAMPMISSDDAQFAFMGDADTIAVTITNANNAAVSNIQYRVNGGSWIAYAGTFDLAVMDFTGGAEVEARAVSTSSHWIDSDLASHFMAGPVGTPLDPPVIGFSNQRFQTGVDTITVTLTDNNPPASSTVWYQIVPVESGFSTGFMHYTGSFSVASASYPSGFAINAYAKSVSQPYTDSVFAWRSTGSYFGDDVNAGGLRGRFFDLKKYADGTPTNIEADTVDWFNATYYGYLVQLTPEITPGSVWGINPAVLEQFHSPEKRLYASRFATPDLDAILAPDVYGVGGSVAPTNWIAHYNGAIEPQVPGWYRFSGRGDDVVMVWIDGKLVLSAAFWPWEVTPAFPWTGGPDWSGYVATHPNPPYTDAPAAIQTDPLFGVWVYLDGRHEIDVIVGEQPGGDFYVNLRVEKQGVSYADGPQVFTTRPLSGDDAIEVQGSNPTSVPGTSNPPVFFLVE